mmetsp:Transcript_540/g.1782  ORF Transcript_540/g.1782 Transcript_540/m.1782 type:complete len:249 (+) Transcript_540:911-1657(+)
MSKLVSSKSMKPDTSSVSSVIPVASMISLNASSYEPTGAFDTESLTLLEPDFCAEGKGHPSCCKPGTALRTGETLKRKHCEGDARSQTFLRMLSGDSMRSLIPSLALSLCMKSFINLSRSTICPSSCHSTSKSVCSFCICARRARSSACAASRFSYASIERCVILASSSFLSFNLASVSAYSWSFSMRSRRNCVIIARSSLFFTILELRRFCDCCSLVSSRSICRASAWLSALDALIPPIFRLRSSMF